VFRRRAENFVAKLLKFVVKVVYFVAVEDMLFITFIFLFVVVVVVVVVYRSALPVNYFVDGRP
jgi:hypothetical protein